MPSVSEVHDLVVYHAGTYRDALNAEVIGAAENAG
jgi:hypothetical protein